MSEQDTEEVNDALEAAVQAELLQERDGQAFAFSHVLVQHALYAELSGLRRRRLHLAAGRALETMPERRRRAPAELAWHFLEADDAAQALRYSLLAGDEAEGVFAHAGAEQHYRTAVTLAAELQDAPREAEAHEKLGKVLWILGRHDEALAALERALEMQEKAGNLDAEGRIAAAMGWVLADLGRPEEGACRLQIVTERLEASGPSPGLVELYTTLVHLCLRRGRRRDLPALAERAAALAQTARDGRMRAQAELVHGFALVHDRVDEALALFEDVIPAAEKAGDNRTWSRALLLAGRIYADRGEFERSRAYLERNMELHQRTGNGKWLADALRYRGELLVVQGDWSAARENYEQSIGMAVPFTSPIAAWIRLSLARLCLLEGTWQDADAYLEECAEAVERSGDRSSVPKLQALLAARDLWHGQADVALARLEPLASQFDLDHDQLMTLAEVYMMTGNIARAAEVVTGGAAWAAKQNSRLAGVDWRRLHGTLLAGQERWDEAERALSEAASLAAALTYPYAHARALYDWGLMCIQRRAREEAQGHLEAALAVFRRIGAHPFVERTEEALVEVR